ncbi:hypothetical protein L21SP2_2398 [Salinispira pacifica]|uniref:Uncharacterized protein n=1 Tax=Salinispira pacifica TaxID=1307761 RepID=V5WKN1_9SPIO|nr:hypothetical protein L21SP2_2398 [Salinispira pacifica]
MPGICQYLFLKYGNLYRFSREIQPRGKNAPAADGKRRTGDSGDLSLARPGIHGYN